MRVIALLNSKAGLTDVSAARRQAGEIEAVFRTLEVHAEVRVVGGHELVAAARRAVEDAPDVLIAAGGDGTIGTVAGVLAGSSLAFGVIPKGTFNHFARDLGIPLTLEAAARVIAAGHTRAVDVASANGRVFINNSSIGLYPRIVRHRDQQRARLGRGKWMAMLFATLRALRRFPVVRVRLGIEGQTVLRTTPFVFVGNNEYEMSLFNIGRRKNLDSGQITLYVANRTGRFGMFRLAFRALVGRLEQAKDFDSALLTEFWIDSGKHHLHVAFDGEAQTMTPPIHYRSHPAALRVIVPSTAAPG